MTFKEKLAIEHPDKLDSNCAGGCWGCPSDYGYDERMPCHCTKMLCDECWEREIPGTEPTKITKDKKEKKEMEHTNFSSMAVKAETSLRPVEQGATVCGTMHDLYNVLSSISLATDGLAEILYAVPVNGEKPPEPSCLETEVRLALELALSICARLEEIRARL